MSLTDFREVLPFNLFALAVTAPEKQPAPHLTLNSLPRGWRRGTFNVDGIPHPYHYSPATNPHTTIGFCPGYKATPMSYAKEIKELNDRGFNVMSIYLPPTIDIERHDKIIKKFFLDPASPLYRATRSDLPRIAMVHSLSACLTEQLLQKGDKENFEGIKGIIELAPFFDTANSSEEFNPLLNAFYSYYARVFANYQLGSVVFDRIFSWLKNIPAFQEDAYFHVGAPLHGEADFLRNFARPLRQQMHKGLRPAVDRTFVLGVNDPAACPLTAASLGTSTGAEIIRLPCGHDPLREHDQALGHVPQHAFRYAGGIEKPGRAYTDGLRREQYQRFEAEVKLDDIVLN